MLVYWRFSIAFRMFTRGYYVYQKNLYTSIVNPPWRSPQLHLASSLAWRRSAAPTHPPCASLEPGYGTDVNHLFKTQYGCMHGHEYIYIYIYLFIYLLHNIHWYTLVYLHTCHTSRLVQDSLHKTVSKFRAVATLFLKAQECQIYLAKQSTMCGDFGFPHKVWYLLAAFSIRNLDLEVGSSH